MTPRSDDGRGSSRAGKKTIYTLTASFKNVSAGIDAAGFAYIRLFFSELRKKHPWKEIIEKFKENNGEIKEPKHVQGPMIVSQLLMQQKTRRAARLTSPHWTE